MSPYRLASAELIDIDQQRNKKPAFIWLSFGRGVRTSYIRGVHIDGARSCLVMQDGSTFAASEDECRYLVDLLELSTIEILHTSRTIREEP